MSGTGQKNCDPTCYGHPRLQNSKDLGTFEHHRAKSIAAVSHEEKIPPAANMCNHVIPAMFWVANANAFLSLWLPSHGSKQIAGHDLDAVREVKA